MSRKGKLPIPVPKGVEVKVTGTEVSVKGPKGSLSWPLSQGIEVKVSDDQVHVELNEAFLHLKNQHGLYRSLLKNMVDGTTKGFDCELEMVGIGYRAAIQGNLLDLQIGFSHPTKLLIPTGLQVKVEKGTLITVSGIDKQLVGQFAAIIRSKRPPEPYQGKGIRYKNEYVRKKAGKTAAAKK